MEEPMTNHPPRSPRRRWVLQAGGGALAGTLLIPLAGCGDTASLASNLGGPDGPTPLRFFLTDAERRTLRALVDRLIPGELGPGAADADADLAIDALLGAFLTDPPLIYAGGPYSDRGGAARNDFARFIPLDAYEELAWRIAIEGSQGRPEREFNGPVQGRQAIYREGLAHLDARAAQLATGLLPAALGSVLREQLGDTPLAAVLDLVNTLTGTEGFADLPALLRDVIVLDPTDAATQALVDAAFPDTINAMYGAPEYGGNKDLVGWTSMNFDGDVQPRGYTDAQVIHADTPGLLDFLLPPPFGGDPDGPRPAAAPRAKATAGPVGIAALSGLVGPESLAAMIADADGSLARLRAQIAHRVQHPAVLRWERAHG
jgi:hypothetical protein